MQTVMDVEKGLGQRQETLRRTVHHEHGPVRVCGTLQDPITVPLRSLQHDDYNIELC